MSDKSFFLRAVSAGAFFAVSVYWEVAFSGEMNLYFCMILGILCGAASLYVINDTKPLRCLSGTAIAVLTAYIFSGVYIGNDFIGKCYRSLHPADDGGVTYGESWGYVFGTMIQTAVVFFGALTFILSSFGNTEEKAADEKEEPAMKINKKTQTWTAVIILAISLVLTVLSLYQGVYEWI